MSFKHYPENTMKLTVFGLYIEDAAGTKVYLDDNADTVEISAVQDENGNTISGETFPVAGVYRTGTNGNFDFVVDDSLAVTLGQWIKVLVEVHDGTDRDGKWWMPAKVEERDGDRNP